MICNVASILVVPYYPGVRWIGSIVILVRCIQLTSSGCFEFLMEFPRLNFLKEMVSSAGGIWKISGMAL